LTCKHFGGEVHELGFMVMYFQPAFYCNVSDAWLFPEKSKRLWVGFAGPYLELVLWALATIAWRLTEPDTWINYTSLIVMTLSGLRSFVDFNPFVKLDGYYLLSDYLEVPNLRRRSFKYVGDATDTPEAKQKPRRSRRREITWAGLAAAALAVLFLVHLQLRIAGPFTVLPEENADVRAAVEGIIEEIRVQEGDQVKAGDVIARLADQDVRAELLKTQAQVREARANLRKLQIGTTAE